MTFERTDFEECSFDDSNFPVVTLIFIQNEVAKDILVWANRSCDLDCITVVSLVDD